MTRRPAFHWILAIVLTLGAAAYQRVTGPTHPRRVTYGQGDGRIAARLPRSHGGVGGCAVEIEAPRAGVSGLLRFRRYPTGEAWQEVRLARRGGELCGELPHQPPAGKLEYVVVLEEDGRPIPSEADSATVIRFKGEVPAALLAPHVALMFATMLLASLSGLKALVRAPRHLGYAWAAFALLVVGRARAGPDRPVVRLRGALDGRPARLGPDGQQGGDRVRRVARRAAREPAPAAAGLDRRGRDPAARRLLDPSQRAGLGAGSRDGAGHDGSRLRAAVRWPGARAR